MLIIVDLHHIMRYMSDFPALIQQLVDMGEIFILIDIAFLSVIPAIAQVHQLLYRFTSQSTSF